MGFTSSSFIQFSSHIFEFLSNWNFFQNFCRHRNFDRTRNLNPSFWPIMYAPPENNNLEKKIGFDFEHNRNFDLDRNFERSFNCLKIQTFASRKRYVLPKFLKELHFLERDAKFSIFKQIWKQNALAVSFQETSNTKVS